MGPDHIIGEQASCVPEVFREWTTKRIPPTEYVGGSVPSLRGLPGQPASSVTNILETPNGVVEMSRVQGIDAKVACGHYGLDLEAGWYFVEDSRTGKAFC